MNSAVHTGAAGELIASSYFLSQGLEVFRNVAAAGPVDLFVFNKANGKALPVDIKTFRSPYVRADGSYCLAKNPEFRDDGVWQVAYVYGEGSVRLPEGFWEALGMETAE